MNKADLQIAVVVTARPSYARVQTVLEALQARRQPFMVYAGASALLPKYGEVVTQIRRDGFPVTEVLASCEHNTLGGGVLTTSQLAQGLAHHWLATPPRLVVTIADRKETLATAYVAAYLHIPLFHLLAGERSGSIDDHVRDAVSALSQYHATPCMRPPRTDSSWRVTGCPSVDLALRAKADPPVTIEEVGGTGSLLDLKRPFIIMLQHPVSDEPEAAVQLQETMVALTGLDYPVLALWPGEEAGSDAAAKVLRQLKENYLSNHAWHFVRQVPPQRFYRLLMQCRVLVGNSSVGVREAGALGVPVVDIGTRQCGRLIGDHVIQCDYHADQIRQAVQQQWRALSGYPPSPLYGDGQAGARVADWIQEIVRQ